MILAITALSTGILILLVSLPLIYRKIPRNCLYGVRIEEAFKSDERWYAINEYGGRKLAQWSFLITATGVVGFWIPPEHTATYGIVITTVTLIAVLVPVVQILKWTDKAEEPNQSGEGTA